jgi:integrase
MTIGQHGPRLTFDQAKMQARALLIDAMRGHDPIAERRDKRSAPTITVLARDYLDKYAGPKKRPKSVRDDRAMLQNVILPRLGSQKVAAVGRREIEALHASLEDRPYQANRVLALLSKMFNLAIAWGWRTDNPVKGLKRYHEEKRHRWLQDDELQRLCSALDRHPNQRAANVVRLQLLTGARMGEVLGAKKADFDLTRGVWIKPSHQTKQKRTEHLPLSAPAVALVALVSKGTRETPYLFAGNVEREPFLGVRDAPSGHRRLSTARQSTHLCLAPCLERPQPGDRWAPAGAHEPDHHKALCTSRR